jgi:hypothetical protein
VEQALGVSVEGEGDRTASAVRPRSRAPDYEDGRTADDPIVAWRADGVRQRDLLRPPDLSGDLSDDLSGDLDKRMLPKATCWSCRRPGSSRPARAACREPAVEESL